MYLSAERLALANQQIQETFEQCSVAWQVFPHWDTGDPAQTSVRSDSLAGPGAVQIVSAAVDVDMTLADLTAPSPDGLLTKVTARTATLAGMVDAPVVDALRTFANVPTVPLVPPVAPVQDILTALIDARALLENAGYRAPSCLITDVDGIKDLNQLVANYYILKDQLLDAAYINSLHRVGKLGNNPGKARAIMVGRRQRIAHGRAADASPGEEPVDLAVSVPPSLEVVGEVAANTIRLKVRISYAARIKDANGLVIVGP
jgi:hypothetical protein